ncbi:MAG: hypothetical protein H7210_07275 [Pyrinomonadaceae bacterium]|nr:hypothetical protein [Phycisphaerales bacterium]
MSDEFPRTSRTIPRLLIAMVIALGFASVSVALGLLYLDFTAQQGARVELTVRADELTPKEQETLLLAWRVDRNFYKALVAGTLGVALIGGGLVLVLFELRPAGRQR